jgi:hypothetical protein
MNRRAFLAGGAACLGAGGMRIATGGDAPARPTGLTITGLTITPVALPDPPLLAASGCHGPYFLRNIIELHTDAGIVGVGETHGGVSRTQGLETCRDILLGQSAFAYRRFAAEVSKLGRGVYAGIELACLDAIGRATGRRLCELLGGPVRDEIAFAAYLFFRYAPDHPKLLADPRVVDDRGRGDRALDTFGVFNGVAALPDGRAPQIFALRPVALIRTNTTAPDKLKGWHWSRR